MASRIDSLRLLPVLAALLIAPSAVPAHAATNLLDFYVGAALGHARLRAKDSGLLPADSLGSFDRSAFAYQIMAGVRGLYLLGAEVDYFDFGSGRVAPAWSGAGTLTHARMSQKGEAAFAVLYLPVPVIDFYIKAGVARLTTHLSASANYPGCVPPLQCIAFVPQSGSVDTSETTFAAGAGAQWQFGDWAVRAEYERFTALGEHPDLVTLGVTHSFL